MHTYTLQQDKNSLNFCTILGVQVKKKFSAYIFTVLNSNTLSKTSSKGDTAWRNRK